MRAFKRKKRKIHLKAPDDGSSLSIKERVLLCEELWRLSEKLNPFPRYKPFVKSFDSLKDYEKWRKKQTNPWLV
jgi:hypothetical protein